MNDYMDIERDVGSWIDGYGRTVSRGKLTPSKFGPWIYKKPDGTAWVRVHRFEVTDGDVDKCYLPQPWDEATGAWAVKEDGRPLYKMPDGPRYPLDVDKVIAATRQVFIVEGEKLRDVLAELLGKNDSVAITTCIDGARGWTPDINQYFKGKDCVLVPDHDLAGYDWVDEVTKNLSKHAHQVTVVELPDLNEGDDLEQWVEARLKVEKNRHKVRQQFLTLCTGTPRWDEEWKPKLWRDPTLTRLITELSIIQLKGSVRIASFDDDGILNLMRKDGFTTFYSNLDKKVLAAFFKLANRYTGTVLSVDGAGVGQRLNLWKGWAISPRRGSWSKIEEHMKVVIANADEEFYEYLLKWCAWMVQNPGKQAEVAIVLRGGKGAGKGVFVYVLKCFFKLAQYKHIRDPKHLVGAFNSHLASCSLLFADEAYWPGDKKAEGALKGLITERDIPIEPKGVDVFMVPNSLHIIVAGNENWIVPASHDERRYAAQDVSSEKVGDNEYFAALVHEIENGGEAAMLHDLLAMDLNGWHPRDDVPQTQALDRQKALTRHGMDAFIEQVCHDCFLPCAYGDVHKHIPGSESKEHVGYDVKIDSYWNVAVTSGEQDGQGLWHYIKTTIPGMKFEHARSLTKVLVDDWGCTGDWHRDKVRGIVFPPPSDLRARFERKHGEQQWGTEAPADWQDPGATM